MAGSLDIGTLQGGVEFEDKVSTTLDLILGKAEKLEDQFGGLDHGVRETAQGFFLAETAMKGLERAMDLGLKLVKDFTTEGAAIADVSANFEHLAAGAGRLSDTLLGALREGTHGTITDFELMKMANQDLAAGLNLTDKQFKDMATGAFALAQANAISVADAMEMMNEAMLKGQARSLQTLTGVIDMEAAQTRYAESLGTTVERLTEDEKLEARRAAILDGVTAATARLGEQTDGVDEILAQISTSWTNFYNNLLSSVASSPKVIQAFTDIKETLIAAFGGESQSVTDAFVSSIEYIAERVSDVLPTVLDWFFRAKDQIVGFYGGAVDAWTKYGPSIVGALMTARDWIMNVYEAVVDTYNALPDWLKIVAEKSAMTAAGLYVLNAAGGAVGLSFTDVIGIMGNLATTLTSLPALTAKVAAGFETLIALKAILDFSSLANIGASLSLVGSSIYGMIGPLGIAVGYATALYAAFELGKWAPISDFFFDLGLRIQGFSEAEREAMIETEKATQAAKKAAEAVKGQVVATDDFDETLKRIKDSLAAVTTNTGANTTATDKNTESVRRSAEEAQKFKEAWEAIDNVGKNLSATLGQIDPKLVEQIKKYNEAGVSMEKLKVAFELTDEQARALTETFAAQNQKLEEQTKATEKIAKAWGNLNELGADQEQIIRGIGDRIKQDIGRYADLGASIKDLATAYGLTENQIRAIISVREMETAATDRQTEAYRAQNEELDATQIKVQTLSGDYITLAEAKALQSQGGSFEVNRGNLDESARQWKIPMSVATTMAENGASFQEILAAWQSGDWASWVPHGPRIPGFREGGVGDFGDGTLAMLHGQEAIIPLDKVGGLGNVTNNFYVNGTGQEVADTVASHLMTQLKLRRRYGSA